MYSGEQLFAVRVWRGSHFALNLGEVSDHVYTNVATNLPSNLVIVPPFSVLIGRGDMLHAGASGQELKVAFTSYKGATEAHKRLSGYVFRKSGRFNCNTRGHLTATRGKYFFDSLFHTPITTPTQVIDSNMPP